MTKIAIAVDIIAESRGLDYPVQIERVMGRQMFDALGDDVLLYRASDPHAGYFARARFSKIGALTKGQLFAAFDDVYMFLQPIPLGPAALMSQSRLHTLDDSVFEAVLASSTVRGAMDWLAEGQLPLASPGGRLSAARDRCAFTGKPSRKGAPWTVIWPERADRHAANNFLPLSARAREAFLAGHFSACTDYTIVLKSSIDPRLLERINPTGKLILPEGDALRPDGASLAWHRWFIAHLF